MVSFICDGCQETLKKQKVDQHYCRDAHSFSCVDCSVAFTKVTFQSHTSCVSEAEKYQGALYKPTTKVHRGEAKQQRWMSAISSAVECGDGANTNRCTKLLQRLSEQANVPRKRGKFMRFAENSLNIHDKPLLEEVWKVFASAVMTEMKQEGHVKDCGNVVASKPKKKSSKTTSWWDSTDSESSSDDEDGKDVKVKASRKKEVDEESSSDDEMAKKIQAISKRTESVKSKAKTKKSKKIENEISSDNESVKKIKSKSKKGKKSENELSSDNESVKKIKKTKKIEDVSDVTLSKTKKNKAQSSTVLKIFEEAGEGIAKEKKRKTDKDIDMDDAAECSKKKKRKVPLLVEQVKVDGKIFKSTKRKYQDKDEVKESKPVKNVVPTIIDELKVLSSTKAKTYI